VITFDMVKSGYASGHIWLSESPNGDGVVCRIGDGWFFFGGHTAEDYDSAADYKKDIPVECIVKDIFEVLQDFWDCGHEEFRDEYLYYEYFLQERGVA